MARSTAVNGAEPLEEAPYLLCQHQISSFAEMGVVGKIKILDLAGIVPKYGHQVWSVDARRNQLLRRIWYSLWVLLDKAVLVDGRFVRNQEEDKLLSSPVEFVLQHTHIVNCTPDFISSPSLLPVIPDIVKQPVGELVGKSGAAWPYGNINSVADS